MGFLRLLRQPRIPSSFASQGAELQPSAAVGSTYQFIDIANFSNSANLKYPAMVDQPGDVWFEQDVTFGSGISCAFQYVKITGTVAFAQTLLQEAPVTDTVVAAGSSTQVVQLTTGVATTNLDANSIMYLENGGTNPQIRRIKSHTSTTDSPARTYTLSVRDQNNTTNTADADQLPYTPTNATNVSIIRPYNRQQGSATAPPVGICLAASVGTVTAPVYAPALVAGIGLVSAIGNVNALAVNSPAIPGASGTILGRPAAYAVGTVGIGGGASIIPLFAFSGAGPQAIPCSVNLLGVI